VARLRGDPERAVAFDQQALEHLVEGDWLLGSQIAWNLAVADWLGGRPERAEQALAEVVAARRAGGEGYLAVRVGCDLGQVQRARGRLGAALATYRQGLETAAEVGHQLPHLGMAHVGLAEVLYERDELLAAHEYATRGSPCASSWPTPSRWPPALGCWPGSGRPRAIRPGRWRRSARPSGSG
jgi:LuxR family transcriptional regulator, maltose regulon positive regulatory protein